MPPKVSKEAAAEEKQDLQEYTCERCGYKYSKVMDYPPYLCYRCLRFLAKRVFSIVRQIQPPVSRPDIPEV